MDGELFLLNLTSTRGFLTFDGRSPAVELAPSPETGPPWVVVEAAALLKPGVPHQVQVAWEDSRRPAYRYRVLLDGSFQPSDSFQLYVAFNALLILHQGRILGEWQPEGARPRVPVGA